MSNSVQELFNVSDQLAKNLEISHKLAVPKISKIVISITNSHILIILSRIS